MGNFVVGTRQIQASPETVWRILIDVDHWPDNFTPHLAEAHLEGDLTLGATGWVRTRVPPLRSRFTVTSLDPGRSWAWRGRLAWLTLEFDHVCQPVDGGTRVVFDVDLTGPASGVVRPIARLVYRPQMERALKLLVKTAERDEPHPTST